MMLKGIEREVLVSESDALTTQPLTTDALTTDHCIGLL